MPRVSLNTEKVWQTNLDNFQYIVIVILFIYLIQDKARTISAPSEAQGVAICVCPSLRCHIAFREPNSSSLS